MFKKFICIFLITVFLTNLIPLALSAEQADYSRTVSKAENFASADRLFDSKRSTYTTAGENSAVTLSREDGITHIYIEFDRLPNEWSLIADGESFTCGENGFLHEYINVSALCLSFNSKRMEFTHGRERTNFSPFRNLHRETS